MTASDAAPTAMWQGWQRFETSTYLDVSSVVVRTATPTPENKTTDSKRGTMIYDRASDLDDPIPACTADPSTWDLDASTKDVLKIAARTCRIACPVYEACRTSLKVAARTPRSMVVAGIAYDYNGDVVDLDSPQARTGPRNERDTRWVDEHGRSYDGHTGRWEPSVSATEQHRRRIA